MIYVAKQRLYAPPLPVVLLTGRQQQPSKVDPVVAVRMWKEGKSYAEIARHFEVSPKGAEKAVKTAVRRAELVPDLSRSEISADNISTMKQLAELNRNILVELERSKSLITREHRMLQDLDKLEAQLKRNPEDTDLAKRLKAMYGGSIKTILDIQSSLVNISREARQQIELQVKIAEVLYTVTMQAEFQEEVLEVIGKIEPAARAAIVKRLKDMRTIKGLVGHA
jgi:hypothetical protein